VCVPEVEANEELKEWFKKVGIDVRRGASVKAVYGRDRDILKALREEDRPVLGISPPGVDARLAAADLKRLPYLTNCVKVRVPRIAAENREGRVVAVNEVALLAASPGAFVKYSLYVDGEFMYNDLGDGVLIATPLGSTAYAYSAGGPVIDLRANVVEVVPVNSALRRPPHLLPIDARVELVDAKSREELVAVADGVLKIRYANPTAVYLDSYATLIIAKRKKAVETAPLPPSALMVKKILEELGPLTIDEIVKHSGVKQRTVRHALQRLREAGLVEATADPTDPRKKLYRIK